MKITPHKTDLKPFDGNASARAFTLIQVVGVVIIIATLASIIMGSIKITSDRANAASQTQRISLHPLIQDASQIVSNHNAIARQADQALNFK